MKNTFLLKVFDWVEVKIIFNDKNWNYINLGKMKNIRIYLENTFLIGEKLKKWEKEIVEEKILLKNFFWILTKSIIEKNNFLAPSFQKIYFKNFKIDMSVDRDYFYFEIFDKNKKRAKSETEKYYSLLKRNYVETKTFIYKF